MQRKIWHICLIVLLLASQMGTTGHADTGKAGLPGETNIVSISSKGYHTLALLDNGTVLSWGSNMVGQLGNGKQGLNFSTSFAQPVYENVNGELKVLANIVAVEASQQYSLALSADGTVYGWGLNASNELGRPFEGTYYYPTAISIAGLPPIEQISAGVTHAAALAKDGTVWAWGDNQSGAVGNGRQMEYVERPVQVKKNASEFLTGIKQIHAGNWFTMAVTENGELLGWGYNGAYQLGDLTLVSHSYPVHALDKNKNPLNGIKKVSTGNDYTLALKEDGTLLSWGVNGYGQLGSDTLQGTYSNYPKPVLDKASGDAFGHVVDISAGIAHVAAIREDGSVWTWGGNTIWGSADITGQLGRGDDRLEERPGRVTRLPGNAKVLQAETGGHHTVIMLDNGTLWSMGSNREKQLGGGYKMGSAIEPTQLSLSHYDKAYWPKQGIGPVMGQPYRLTLQLAGHEGQPVSFGTDIVDMQAVGAMIVGPVSYVGEGRYAADMLADSPGPVQVTARINGLEVPAAQIVVLSGEPHPAQSELTATPSMSAVGSADPVVLRLQLRDADGNELNRSGGKAAFTSSLGTVSEPVETSYGVYEAELRSDTAGIANIGVTLDGKPFEVSAKVSFRAGTPNRAYSTLTANPKIVVADGKQSTDIKLHIKDVHGNDLDDYLGPIELTSSLGQMTTVTESAYGVYESTLVSNQPGIATISASSLEGLLLADPITVEFELFIQGISFNKQQYELEIGSSLQASLIAADEHGNSRNITSNSKLTIEDETIATISTEGLITGKGKGQTVLNAVYGTHSTSAVIKVTDKDVDPGPDPNPDPGSGSNPRPNPGTVTEPESNSGSGSNPIPTPGTDKKPDSESGKGDKPAVPPAIEDQDPVPGRGDDGERIETLEFSDVKGHWAEDAIMKAVKSAKISGYPDKTFRPNAYITRAEFVVLLNRWFGPFASVEADRSDTSEYWPDWSKDAISDAMQAGILKGYKDGTIRPNQSVTRGELAVMLQRAMKLAGAPLPVEGNSSLSAYNDHALVPAWSREAMMELSARGLIQGDSQSNLRPGNPATRAETVVLLTRLEAILEQGN
ncbi:RCC1 domain-containing protein [Paenibacillus sp. HGF5]|uniref:RCC1 domain-containing protein n=1 Tax=Paenibacillus sp. HGF5 TaxID=908341 RepID=UPI00031E1532|nr:invasin domain 3-containing protein [Paenibacillus sp. HGF5]